MKKIVLLSVSFVLLLLMVSTVSALVEPGVTSNICRNPTDGFINFEDGVEKQVVASSIPGVVFINTDGLDWLYADMRTGYNSEYARNGDFVAWLGETGSQGKISFTEDSATYVSALVSTYSGVQIDAFDKDGTFLVSSGSSPGTLGTGTMTRLTVEAPAGKKISYVVVHDSGNYWIIDDICTDASGIPPVDPPVNVPEFPTAFLPVAMIIGFVGVVLLIQRTKEH